MKEKVLNNKKNGMLVLILTTLLYLLSIAVCVVGAMIGNPLLLGISIFWMCVGWFPYCGLRVLKPQEALVLTLFGKYTGTLKGEGFYAVNPFCTSVNPAADTHLNKVVMLTTVQENLHFQDYWQALRKNRFGIGRKEDFFKDYDFEQQPSKD